MVYINWKYTKLKYDHTSDRLDYCVFTIEIFFVMETLMNRSKVVVVLPVEEVLNRVLLFVLGRPVSRVVYPSSAVRDVCFRSQSSE